MNDRPIRAVALGFFDGVHRGHVSILQKTAETARALGLRPAALTFRPGCVCPPEFPVCVCGRKPKLTLVTRKPIVSGPAELEENPRARSAKLRVAERTAF